MLLFSVETREDLHRVYDFTLFLGPLAFVLLGALKIKQASLNHKLLPADSLVKTSVVKLDNRVLKLDVFWRVFLKELHVCKKQFSIHIILLIEVTSFGKIAHNLSTCLDSADVLAGLYVSRV